jgi:hypothetical protein
MSLASVWMVICGIAFNYFYFYHFNILITEYIDLSESLLMFIPIAIKVLGSITVVFIVFLVLQVLTRLLAIRLRTLLKNSESTFLKLLSSRYF